MENVTECIDLEFRLEYWIGSIAICSLVSLIFFYVLLALVYHEIRVKKSRQIGFLQLSIEERYLVLSKYRCISYNIAFFVLYISLVSKWFVVGIKIFRGSITAAETVCIVFSHISDAAVTIGNGLVYLFLWFRQRVIYVHPSLKVLNNKYVSVFSFAVLALWILFWISLLIAYLIKVQYRFNRTRGCVIDKDSAQPFNVMVFTWTAVSILIQISLLCLFVYPILKQARWRDQRNIANLIRRVKKAVVFAMICLGTDIATIVVYLFLATECVVNSVIWVYSINLLINHLMTIGCFDHWKKLLWPVECKMLRSCSCGVRFKESYSSSIVSCISEP